MKDPIIVTGAAGFIGRNVVASLNAQGVSDLLLVDRLGTDERWRNLRGLAFEDVITPETLLGLVESGRAPKASAIVHLGACSATTERDAGFLLENNYRCTRTLCTWALKNDARFVYASSAATYGDGAQGYNDDVSKLSELKPLNMYGYSKHLFDLWAQRNGLFDKIAGLKYFNVYGPFEDHKADMRSLVHKAYGQILARGWIELFKSDRPDFADGEQKRDFVYVRDAVAVTLHFLEHRESSGLFNCGTGQARTWLDLARALFAAMGRKPDIRFIDMPPVLRGKYQYLTQADTSKLRAAGYKAPFMPLEAAIKDYVQTHLQVIEQ
ncbi:MAG: ADP-glyceromanno-heptose 6-epimerase [Opitutaceae bacterium]|jgi:ADP-L-glycero-D-manno-heptose 6-epimerase